jgi:predicted enzyme related to lactoylglutathione lyase
MGTGSFIWYELMTPDPGVATAFYGAVVGWSVPGPQGIESGVRDYRMILRSDGRAAGGMLGLTPGMQQQGAMPCWLPYMEVKDVAATTRAIEADGGTTWMRMDLPVGQIAMVGDPLGTPFYVMRPIPPPDQPDAKSDVFDTSAPQRVRWNELASPDLQRAKQFYARHFGYRFNEVMPMGDLGDYCFMDHDGVRVGAIMQRAQGLPAAGWVPYFGVESAAAACRAIEAHGGRLLQHLHQVPGGEWVAVAADPAGAVFGITGPQGS